MVGYGWMELLVILLVGVFVLGLIIAAVVAAVVIIRSERKRRARPDGTRGEQVPPASPPQGGQGE